MRKQVPCDVGHSVDFLNLGSRKPPGNGISGCLKPLRLPAGFCVHMDLFIFMACRSIAFNRVIKESGSSNSLQSIVIHFCNAL